MIDKINKKELKFIQTVLYKPAFFEFIHEMRIREFQKKILLDPSDNISVDCARGVGKTMTLITDIISTALTNPKKEGLLTTPYNAHISGTWDKIISILHSKFNAGQYLQRCARSPDYLISFKNGFILHGRVASASSGQSLLSLHVDFAWIDEAQLFFPAETNELQGCLNQGRKLKIFGVPNGIRKSYLYKAKKDSEFSNYNVNKFVDENYTQEDDDRMALILGGRNSQAYTNQILGLWGLPQEVVFPERWWGRCLYEEPEYKIIILDDESFPSSLDDLDLFVPLFQVDEIRITADIGYNPDPTIIGIFYKQDENFYLFQKLILHSIDTENQARILDYLANVYKAKIVALDSGNIGKAIYLMLNKRSRNYNLIPVNFGSSIVIGQDSDGKAIKERVKYYSTVKLNEYFKNQKLFIPQSDEQIQNELRNTTQNITTHGNHVYSGIDHNTDMLRIFAICDLLYSKNYKYQYDIVCADF